MDAKSLLTKSFPDPRPPGSEQYAGQCRAYAALPQWSARGHGRRLTAGHLRQRGALRDALERIQALLNKQVTAIEVADAAQNFGQQDDISVITVARTALLVPALV